MSLINHSRRHFIRLSLALLTIPFTPSVAKADEQDMALYVSRDGVEKRVKFIENGAVIESGYLELCHFFKDINADVAVQMDMGLFMILAKGQKWLASYGYTLPLHITSAYRTLFTNSHTEGAARDSLHMYGRAVDLKYPGLPIRYLAVLFRTFGAAGIGIYSSFLHIDTWKERVWRG